MSTQNIYDNYTINSPSFIKRFAHRTRYGNSVNLALYKGNSLLDYGTGSGRLLAMVAEQRPDADLIGYEPFDEFVKQARENNQKFKNVKIVLTLEELSDKKFDNVSCFEVFEHLDQKLQVEAITNMKSFLKAEGRIIISVPIETGPSSFFKNLARWVAGAPHTRNVGDIIKVSFGLPVKRIFKEGWTGSHIGFRIKDLENLFYENGLEIEKVIYSPIKWLYGFCSSQKFYIIKIKK